MEFSDEYDQAVAYAMDNIRERAAKGDPECMEQLHRKVSVDFIWKLLKFDIIEQTGRSRNGSNALSDLAQRISAKTDTPLDIAEQELGTLAKNGLIAQRASGNRTVWQWT